MTRLRIYVPSLVLPVRVRLGYGSGGLSPMEASLLRVVIGLSVQAGDDGATPEPVPLRDVVQVVGLGSTMTTHLVADLWRQGHLALDMRNELVTPDAATVAAHRAGKIAALSTGETALDVVEVLQETVTGQVMGQLGLTRPPEPRLALPRSPLFHPSVDEISPSALLAAAAQVVEQAAATRTDEDHPEILGRARRPTIREAHLDRSSTALPVVRWLPLEISVRRDADGDALRVEVADRGLDAANRALAGRRIAQYLEESPEHPFTRHLAGQAGAVLTAPETPERALGRLGRLLAGARTAEAGTRQSQHDRLRDAVERARRQLDERRSAGATVRVVGTGEAHQAEVQALIGRAEHQLVLASPVVTPEALQALLDPLEEMLVRGVQLVLIWGSRQQGKLDDRVARMLTSLRRVPTHGERSTGVLWSTRPARSAACFALADARDALVGGCPPLGPRPRRGELALAVTAVDPHGSRPLQELLVWSRRAMPDHAVSQNILFRAAELGAPPPGDPVPTVPGSAAYPGLPPDHDGPDTAPAVSAWVEAWTEVVDQVRAAAAAPEPPVVSLVEDGAHRHLFWDHVREAGSRIVIGADEVAGKIVEGRPLDVLRRKLDAGVPLRVVHRRGKPDGHGRDGHALLRTLAVGRPPGTCLIDRAQSNGRAVVCDDTVLVGSFDFLAHEGYFSSTGSRADSELGLLVTDREAADAVAAALGAVTVDAGVPTPLRERARDAPVAQAGAGAALLLMTALGEARDDETRRVALVHAAVEDSGTELLDALESAGAPDDVLRVAAAWWLLGTTGAEHPDTARWTAWLLREAWRRGDVAGSWVLRRAVDAAGAGPAVDGAGARVPDETIIRLTAALDGPQLGEIVQGAALADDAGPDLLRLLVLVAAAELAAGQPDPASVKALLDTLVFLADLAEISAPLSDLANVLGAAEPDAFPFPVADLHASQDRRRSREQLDAAWQAVGDAVTAAAGTSFVFEAGIKTHAHLFHPAGLFGDLAGIVARRDLAAARLWARSSELRDLGGLVDKISDMVTQGHSRMVSGPRRGYLMKLSSVVTAARRLGRHPDPPPDDDTIRRRVAAARPLAEAVARLWPAVPVAMAATRSPEREISDRMLDRLTPVVEWGRATDG